MSQDGGRVLRPCEIGEDCRIHFSRNRMNSFLGSMGLQDLHCAAASLGFRFGRSDIYAHSFGLE